MNVERFLLKGLQKKPSEWKKDIEVLKSYMVSSDYEDFFCEALLVEAKMAAQMSDVQCQALEQIMQHLQPYSDHQIRGNIHFIKMYKN